MMNTYFEKKFSILVRRLRGSRSQQEYSGLLGVSRVTVANWERGKITDIPMLERLAHSGAEGRNLVRAIFSLLMDDQVVEASQVDSDCIP